MTPCLPVLAGVVAAAAAVRSTWSPCGLSMLSTITPFSERGRGHTYRTTAAWFVVGATVGGATLGLVMAGLALAVAVLPLSANAAGSLALLAALVSAGSDSGIAGARLPFHRRQVNERWLDRYRPWVYGAGFGWQIGCGLATYITSAAVYLMIVLSALAGRPMVAVVIGTGFGLLRGMAVLLTRRLSDPSELLAFHRRFLELAPLAGRVVVGTELASAAVLVLWLRTPESFAVVGIAGLATVALIARRRRTAPTSAVPTAGGEAEEVMVTSARSYRPG